MKTDVPSRPCGKTSELSVTLGQCKSGEPWMSHLLQLWGPPELTELHSSMPEGSVWAFCQIIMPYEMSWMGQGRRCRTGRRLSRACKSPHEALLPCAVLPELHGAHQLVCPFILLLHLPEKCFPQSPSPDHISSLQCVQVHDVRACLCRCPRGCVWAHVDIRGQGWVLFLRS